MDVAVIGGGIVGTSAAGFLAAGGAKATLFEREAIAAGASGRNSGVIQHPFDPALVPLYRETVEIYRSLDLEAVPAGFRLADRPSGLMLVSWSPAVVAHLARELAAIHPHLEPEVLDADQVRRLEPALAPGLVACRIEIGFPVVPAAPTYAMATLAERRGAVIRQGHAVAPLIRDGRCVGVSIDGRFEGADAVLVAAGPWTPGVVDATEAWRPIRPVWGVVVETLLADPPRHVLEEAEMDAALSTDIAGVGGQGPAEGGQSAWPGDDGGSLDFSLVTAGGVSVVGSTFLERPPDSAAWTEPLLLNGSRFVPAIRSAPIRETRRCARPVSLDGRPLIGSVPGIEGLYVCAGHGPWGITTGPASARLVADAILGRAPAIEPALLAARFPLPRSS